MTTNQTFAVVAQPGQSCVSFPVSLPRSEGFSSVNKKTRAILRGVACTPRELANVDYRIYYGTDLARHYASYAIKTGPKR